MTYRINRKSFFELVKETFVDWYEDKVPRLGAALAFYSVLSIGPLLLLALAAAGAIFGEEAAQGKIVQQIQGMIGEGGAIAIQDMIKSADQNEDAGIVATVIGLVTLLIGASGVFGQLQDAMNTIWQVKPKDGQGVMGFIRNRFLSFSMVLGTGFLLLTSLILSSVLAAFSEFTSGYFSNLAVVMNVISSLISFGIISLLFAFIFKYLPDAQISWRDVRVGAIITALLFTLGKYAIGLYLGHSSFSSSYGAAGSLVVFLVWVYYSSQIIFLGAEFTKVYARQFGTKIIPSANAEGVTEQSRAREGIA